MMVPPEVIEVERLAAAASITMGRVLKRAGVASTTYWRWRNSTIEPHTRTLRRLKIAISELVREAA